MLQQSLKEATKNNHTELEQCMFVEEIMNGTLSAEQYRQLIITNYLVHLKVEDLLINSLSKDIAASLHVEQRHKLPALAADMERLKIEPSSLPTNLSPISFESEAAVLGALYVLEGATLGGNVIVKKLKAIKAILDLDTGFHYYGVYGIHLVDYWKEFCEVINQQPMHTYNTCIDGAKRMFEFIVAVHKAVLNSNARQTS